MTKGTYLVRLDLSLLVDASSEEDAIAYAEAVSREMWDEEAFSVELVGYGGVD